MSEQTDKTDKASNPLRTFSLSAVALILVMFIWQVLADRYTPYTSDTRIMAHVVPISAQVAGEIVELNVSNNDIVEQDTLLATIDPTDYQIAVRQAEAELEKVGQDIGADTASVATAETNLVDAKEDLKYTQVQAARAFELEKKGVLSAVDGDKMRNKLQQAKANVATAQSKLEQEKQRLGGGGEDNPRIRSALAKLSAAKLDLSRTEVRSPSLGGITNLTLDVGHNAKPGEPLMTLVTTRGVWIDAYIRENGLGNIKAGDEVEIALDVLPGKIYKGTVAGSSFGVDWGQKSQTGHLPSVSQSKGWLRESQRFPVMITFDDDETYGFRRIGGQADVMIYTEDSAVMKLIGKAWIRIVSLFSYLH